MYEPEVFTLPGSTYEKYVYGKPSKILDTSCLPKSADPDQTASEEAV